MEGGKRTPLSVRKKTNTRLVRSIVAYLATSNPIHTSFAPLFSKFSPQMQMPPPPSSFISSKADVKVVKKNKKRLSEKVKEYLNSECHMYRPMISLPKPGTSLQGELRITSLVTMEVSTSSAVMREDNNNYRDLRSSDIAEHTFHSEHYSS
ncbi:hypothetical protein Bca4012_017064 [Brassica carinata]